MLYISLVNTTFSRSLHKSGMFDTGQKLLNSSQSIPAFLSNGFINTLLYHWGTKPVSSELFMSFVMRLSTLSKHCFKEKLEWNQDHILMDFSYNVTNLIFSGWYEKCKLCNSVIDFEYLVIDYYTLLSTITIPLLIVRGYSTKSIQQFGTFRWHLCNKEYYFRDDFDLDFSFLYKTEHLIQNYVYFSLSWLTSFTFVDR